MVPEPMISTPFSAWTFRIENMRSCLRIVDAPSTPIPSAIATRSAGLFFFKSFKCIVVIFSWGRCSSFSYELKAETRQDAAAIEEERRPARLGKLAGAARDRRDVGP